MNEMNDDDETPIQLFGGVDQKGNRLLDALKATLDVADGCHIMTILGAIWLFEEYVLKIERAE